MKSKPTQERSGALFLWRYPVQMAGLLLGTADAEQVAARVTAFADTYDDTANQIEHIRPTVNAIWAGPGGVRPGRFRRAFERHLDGLAFEAMGASVNWFKACKCIPQSAVFLWVARLCCCEQIEALGSSTSVQGLSDFALLSSSDWQELFLLKRICRSLLLRAEGDEGIALVGLLASVCVSLGRDGHAMRCLDPMLTTGLDPSLLVAGSCVWWDAERQRLSGLGVEQFRFKHAGLHPEVDEAVLARHAKALRLFEQMLARLL